MEQKGLTGYPSIDKPWLKYYSEEAINAPLPECTIYEHILNCNKDNLNRVALNYYGTNITYRALFKQIDKTSSALENIGVREGDIVTVCMINSPESIYLMFALNKIGAVANMVYISDQPATIKSHILSTNSKYVFTLDIFQSKILESIDGTQADRVIVAAMTGSMSFSNRMGARIIKKMKPIPILKDTRFVSWSDFASLGRSNTKTTHNANAVAFITYTGGTTGGSKGVRLSNKAVIAVSEGYIAGEKELYRDSKWIQVMPLFIAYGVTCSLMIPLIVGMTLIVRIPMSESIADMYRKFRPNHIMYGPAFWEEFANDDIDFDLSNLIAPITGGDVLPEKVENKINEYLERCGSLYKIMNGYGMSEVGAAVSCNFKDKYEFGSVGAPFVKNIISAFDVETGEELPYGKEGEICIHTPSVMDGYINDPEETANIIRKHNDGLLWVHSGDLGYISEGGFVHISGRLKRYLLYISNGVQKKVFGLDVEKVLFKHPLVEKCAVVPLSDETVNQVPVAFIVTVKCNVSPDEITKELKQFAEANLEIAYRPVQYFFMEKFPLTKVGKVDYRELEKMAESQDKGE